MLKRIERYNNTIIAFWLVIFVGGSVTTMTRLFPLESYLGYFATDRVFDFVKYAISDYSRRTPSNYYLYTILLASSLWGTFLTITISRALRLRSIIVIVGVIGSNMIGLLSIFALPPMKYLDPNFAILHWILSVGFYIVCYIFVYSSIRAINDKFLTNAFLIYKVILYLGLILMNSYIDYFWTELAIILGLIAWYGVILFYIDSQRVNII